MEITCHRMLTFKMFWWYSNVLWKYQCQKADEILEDNNARSSRCPLEFMDLIHGLPLSDLDLLTDHGIYKLVEEIEELATRNAQTSKERAEPTVNLFAQMLIKHDLPSIVVTTDEHSLLEALKELFSALALCQKKYDNNDS
jgi:hypothetical protein